MMQIGIIGAMNEEIAPLLNKIKKCNKKTIGDHIYYEGILNKKNVVITTSGIGKVNAGVTTSILINSFNCSVIINTGSAGCLLPEGQANIGDIVISEKVAYHDVNLTNFGYKHGQLPGNEQFYIADQKLIDTASSCSALNLHKGLIVSGDQFICSKEQSQTILNNFPDATVCEMEGAAIAHVASSFKIPFIIIRSISDGANIKSTVTFEDFLPTAAKNAATMTEHILANIN